MGRGSESSGDPCEKAPHASNTYWDWYMSRIFVVVPIQGLAARFL